MESSGLMMNIIRILNDSKDDAERNEIKKKLENSLKDSDAKLTKYVADYHKDLKQVIQSFTIIYSNLESTLLKLEEAQNRLMSSRDMLELRLEDLNRLSEEARRNDRVLKLLEQEEEEMKEVVIENVEEVDEQIPVPCYNNADETDQKNSLFSFSKSSHALCINEHYREIQQS